MLLERLLGRQVRVFGGSYSGVVVAAYVGTIRPEEADDMEDKALAGVPSLRLVVEDTEGGVWDELAEVLSFERGDAPEGEE